MLAMMPKLCSIFLISCQTWLIHFIEANFNFKMAGPKWTDCIKNDIN